MPTISRTISTTSQGIIAPAKGELVDILIQNLSANNLYVGSSQEVSAADGIRVTPNGSYANDSRKEPVFLIADGADSDVRIFYEVYRRGER